jgi:hypothetical protein
MDANNFFNWVVPALFAKTQGPQPITITIKREGYDSEKKVEYLYEHAACYFVKNYSTIEG